EFSGLALKLIGNLYLNGDTSICIPAENTKEYEPLILAIWSQQWPALRAKFKFCTGSLSNRTLFGTGFDLQVAPRRMARELQKTGVLIIDDQDLGELSEDWQRYAAADLIDGNSPFRQF